jgi:hypothetical protein
MVAAEQQETSNEALLGQRGLNVIGSMESSSTGGLHQSSDKSLVVL